METKLYVGNLAHETTEEDLRKLFAQAGEVESVDLIKDRESGRSKGFAFVVMGDQSQLEKAMGMFDMGFLPDIRRILAALPRSRQTLLFSATMPDKMRSLVDEFLRNPVSVEIGASRPVDTVGHAVYPVEHSKKLGIPYTIFRPVAFMNNFFWQRPAITNGVYSGWGLRPEKSLQLIAADDIGVFVALAFEQPGTYLGKTLEIAGDELTEKQIVDTLGKVIGRPVELAQSSPPDGSEPDEEQLAMFRFFNGQGYDADIPALREIYPDLRTLERWLRETGWENAPVEPMPEEPAAWGS